MAGADDILRKELAFDQIAASDQNFLFAPLQKVINKKLFRYFFSWAFTADYYLIAAFAPVCRTIPNKLHNLFHFCQNFQLVYFILVKYSL